MMKLEQFKRFTNNPTSTSKRHINPMVQWELLNVEPFSPPTDLCPYMALHKNTSFIRSTEKLLCTLDEFKHSECVTSLKFYNRSLTGRSCDRFAGYEFCKFKQRNRRSAFDEMSVDCDVSLCGGKSVYVGLVDPQTGKVPSESEWREFKTKFDLEKAIPALLKESSINSYDFGFIVCETQENEIIRQFLVFPPIVKVLGQENQTRINVNIIVEDSVSRPHLYRAMPKTIQKLREIMFNQSISASVLEYKLFQSVASYTYKNIQGLMSGTTYKGIRTYGIQLIYNHFKKKGYQTLFQEDSCWYDYYGTMIYPEYRDELPVTREDFAQIWEDFQRYLNAEEITKGVDSLGLTVSACKIYKDYGVTNQYRSKYKKFCWGGKHFSTYFLQYVVDLLREKREVNNSAPLFLYTHLTTSHEPSGQRIANDDEIMVNFMKKMADESNTLTIFLSDHGSKTTRYSLKTSRGREEVFDPFLFMIIPHALARRLGRKKITNMVLNQDRLITLLDVHNMLMSLNDADNENEEQSSDNGLFSLVNMNRTCAELDLEGEVLCKCAGAQMYLSDRSKMVLWLSSFALGTLNNVIQTQSVHSRINEYKEMVFGYGKCVRYYGKRVERARQTLRDGYRITTFALVLGTTFGKASEEIFEITTKHPVTKKHGVQLESFVRVSIFGRYKTCADKGVDLHLCTCSDLERTTDYNVSRIMMRKNFGIKPLMIKLDKCLLLTKRRLAVKMPNYLQTWVMTYEVGNQCEDVVYRFKMSGKLRTGRLSSKLPIRIMLYPKSVHFVVSAFLDWKYGHFKPKISYKRYVKEISSWV